MSWTENDIHALAPDAASIKAAQGLVKPAQWSDLGASAQAVWGACQGSGSKPYQTQIDISAAVPSFKCSCPSRKFPCKHGLALLLMQVRQPALFANDQPPAWVSEWLQGRAEKAQKKEEKQREQAAKAAEKAADPQAAAKAAQAAEKTERQRWARIDAGVADLRQWLQDQIERGLGSLAPQAQADWHTQAARLVDAQAPLLAQRLRDAAEHIRQGEHWPEQLLRALGLLQLACDALARRDQLSPPELADLRTQALGWPLDKAQVLASQPPVADHWLVLGQIQQAREGKLTERRVWLHGQHTGRLALLLEHAHAGRGFDSLWTTARAIPATLAFYPSAAPLRALLISQEAPGLGEPPATPDQPVANQPTPDEWTRLAQHTAACPWTVLHPWRSQAARPCRSGNGFALQDSHGRQTSLAVSEADGWALLALSGGQPLHLHAEWDGQRLRPLWARLPAQAAQPEASWQISPSAD